jgi:hypothetical protein
MTVFDWLAQDTGESAAHCAALFEGWEVTYHQDAAAALTKGQEIHFVVAQEWRKRLIQRQLTQAFLAPLLAKAGGMLTTRVLREAAGPQKFVERIGFEKTWEDEKFKYYALCSAPFQRRRA